MNTTGTKDKLNESAAHADSANFGKEAGDKKTEVCPYCGVPVNKWMLHCPICGGRLPGIPERTAAAEAWLTLYKGQEQAIKIIAAENENSKKENSTLTKDSDFFTDFVNGTDFNEKSGSMKEKQNDDTVKAARRIVHFMTVQMSGFVLLPAVLLVLSGILLLNLKIIAGTAFGKFCYALIKEILTPFLSMLTDMEFNADGFASLLASYQDIALEYGRTILLILETTAAMPAIILLFFSASAVPLAHYSIAAFNLIRNKSSTIGGGASTDIIVEKYSRIASFARSSAVLCSFSLLLTLFCIYGSWSYLQILIAGNITAFTASWLFLRFFTVRSGLKKMAAGKPLHNPGSFILYAGMSSVLIFLFCIDLILFPLVWVM